MGSGFSIALSGLNAQSAALDVVSNNIANLNTTGYKASSAQFLDLVREIAANSPRSGGGVAPPLAERNFTQGTLQLTSGAFDAAIQGNGLFLLQSASGAPLYTRAGNFHLDTNGNLVTNSGDFVLGWSAVNGQVTPNGAVGKITVPTQPVITPTPTTQFSMGINLNAAAAVNDTFSAPIQIVDSLGATHTLTVTFTKTNATDWAFDVTIPGADLTSGKAGTPSSVAKGTVSFDSNGQLKTPAASAPVDVKITGFADGASDLDVKWNLYTPTGTPMLTQFSQASALSTETQDGIAAGQLVNVSLANGGLVVAQFSNGKQQVIAQIALAGITNPDTLVDVGQNNYMLGVDTATPAVGAPNTGGRGQIQAGALESSTADIATEFTNLIVYQRSYQANSRVITTLDQITQDLMQIRP